MVLIWSVCPESFLFESCESLTLGSDTLGAPSSTVEATDHAVFAVLTIPYDRELFPPLALIHPVLCARSRPDASPVLCGVTRVGLVAKGLLIKGDMDLELVLMCREKPTKLLLYTISANLPLQIQVQWPAATSRESTAEDATLGRVGGLEKIERLL